MTDFCKSGSMILKDWKKFRSDISLLNTFEQILETIDFWKNAPLVNFVLNYNEYKKWPSPWELIYENFYDSVVLSYVMSQTLLLIDDNQNHELWYIKPDSEHDYCMILIINNEYVLNYSYGNILHKDDLKYDNCLIKLKYENKKLKEI